MRVRIVVCIPAHYASKRFVGKVLAKDTGKFLIQHTYEQACLAKSPEKVIIAADDQRIIDAAKTFGAQCLMTSPEHESGTDRIAEAVADMNADIVVNLQADEPEIDPANIDYAAKLLIENPDYPMATLAANFQSAEQISDPNIVKVVVTWIRGQGSGIGGRGLDGQRVTGDERRATSDELGRAIYFSRTPIPYDREKAGLGDVGQYLRHVGIYAYRKEFLLKFTSLLQKPLEKIEKLEQLRAIENGFPILVGKVKHTCDGIDTPEQYAEFVKRYKKKYPKRKFI
jgi:3-deoxy-manno-octulosonate cytidylyltransferase (CMP-KDO synthetase)